MNEEEKKESPPTTDDSPQQSEQLNTPSTDEPGASSETSTDVEPPITHNTQPVTEQDMEVHHHTHHEHGKRNWKSYFWEFLMLFLAVFSGFLAEIQLEHYIEHQRENKFIKQLLIDINADEANLNEYLHQQKIRLNRIDSLYLLVKNKSFEINKNDIYYFSRIISRYGNYVPTEGTIIQLKYGGNLRLIKNDKIVSSILDYSNNSKMLTDFINTSFQDVLNFRITTEEIFDAVAFYEMIGPDNEIIRLNNCPPLLTKDPIKINSFLMRVQYMKSATRRYINLANTLLEKNKQLKITIQKNQ